MSSPLGIKTIVTTLVLGAGIFSGLARAETVEDRVRQTFEATAAGKRPSGPWLAEWYFAHGQKEKGLEVIYRTLDAIKPDKQGHPFEAYGIADCYIRYGHLFDAAHQAKWKAVANGRGAYSYNLQPFPYNYATPNLRMTGGVTWYLGAQGLGLQNLPKEYPPADDLTRVKWLYRITDQIARTGMPEYASRPYGAYNVIPLLCLRDSAADKVLAHRAGVAFEAFLACAAPMWLGGHWVVATGRSYPDIHSQFTNSNINFLWVYFGGVPGDAKAPGMPAAALPYRPPEYLVTIANRRDKPYVATSRVSYVKDDDPAVEHRPSNLLQYTYMNRSYGIFSQPTNPGAVLPEQQTYGNGVMWLQPEGGPSFLWATIPGGGSSHSAGSIAKGLEFVQREESWLMVGKPSVDDPMHYILGFIPRGYQAIADDAASEGRILLAYKSVLIAISLPGPFKWDSTEPIYKPKKGEEAAGAQFRYPGDSLALALETRHPDDVPGATSAEKLKNFRAEIRAKAKLTLVDGLAAYRTATGHTLQRRVGEMGVVDGVPYDVTRKPFLENPWMRQDYQQDVTQPCKLTVSVDGKTHVYDLLNWTITHRDGPAQPTHLVADASKGKVDLHWRASLGEPTAYKIKRATSGGGPYAEIGTAKTAEWNDTAVTEGAAYFYVVSAVNAGGESEPSLEAAAYPGTDTPVNPSGLAAVPGNAQVVLSWTAVNGATQYKVRRATACGGPYEIVGSSDKACYADTTVKNNTNYQYVVTAVNAGWESGFSNEECAMPLLPPPPAPTGVTAKIVDGKVTVGWNPVPGAVHYNVKRSGAPGGLFSTRGITTDKTTWTDDRNEVSRTGNDWCRVTAVNAGGDGMPSGAVNASGTAASAVSAGTQGDPATE